MCISKGIMNELITISYMLFILSQLDKKKNKINRK